MNVSEWNTNELEERKLLTACILELSKNEWHHEESRAQIVKLVFDLIEKENKRTIETINEAINHATYMHRFFMATNFFWLVVILFS